MDAGANIGFYTVLAARLVGSAGQVVSIEMMPDTARILRRHVDLNDLHNVTVVEKALFDQDGVVVDAHVSNGKSGQASISAQGDGRTVNVLTTTLDVALADVAAIRLLKMDLEGSEETALRGAEAVLSRTDALIFECWAEETPLEKLLVTRGFSVRSLDRRNRLATRDRTVTIAE